MSRESNISGAMKLSVDEQGDFTIVHEPPGKRFRFSTMERAAAIRSFGTYVLAIDTEFLLGDPAIVFPGGQPKNVEIEEVGKSTFTLRILVSRKSSAFPQEFRFEINSNDSDGVVIVDPTVLVDPPRGKV